VSVSVLNGSKTFCYAINPQTLEASSVQPRSYCNISSNNYLIRSISNVTHNPLNKKQILLQISHRLNGPGYNPAGISTYTKSYTFAPMPQTPQTPQK
jgi:hypothetical protein